MLLIGGLGTSLIAQNNQRTAEPEFQIRIKKRVNQNGIHSRVDTTFSIDLSNGGDIHFRLDSLMGNPDERGDFSMEFELPGDAGRLFGGDLPLGDGNGSGVDMLDQFFDGAMVQIEDLMKKQEKLLKEFIQESDLLSNDSTGLKKHFYFEQPTPRLEDKRKQPKETRI